MRAVFDTNVLLSALLWGGPPHALLEQVRNGTVTLISSPALLAELARVCLTGFEGIPILTPAQALQKVLGFP